MIPIRKERGVCDLPRNLGHKRLVFLLSILVFQGSPFGVQCLAAIPNPNGTTPFETLGISPENATVDDVKKAYRVAVRMYHPDTNSLEPSEYFPKMTEARNAAMDIIRGRVAAARKVEGSTKTSYEPFHSSSKRQPMDGVPLRLSTPKLEKELAIIRRSCKFFYGMDSHPLSLAYSCVDSARRLHISEESVRVWYENDVFPYLSERQEEFLTKYCDRMSKLGDYGLATIGGVVELVTKSGPPQDEDIALAKDLIEGLYSDSRYYGDWGVAFAEKFEPFQFVSPEIRRSLEGALKRHYGWNDYNNLESRGRAKRLLRSIRKMNRMEFISNCFGPRLTGALFGPDRSKMSIVEDVQKRLPRPTE